MNTEQKCNKCMAYNIGDNHKCDPLMRALKENHNSKNPPCDEPGCTVCNSSRCHTEQKGWSVDKQTGGDMMRGNEDLQ